MLIEAIFITNANQAHYFRYNKKIYEDCVWAEVKTIDKYPQALSTTSRMESVLTKPNEANDLLPREGKTDSRLTKVFPTKLCVQKHIFMVWFIVRVFGEMKNEIVVWFCTYVHK